MLSLRHSEMRMIGNRSNKNRQSPDEVFAEGFMVAPTDMDMSMTMLGGMYAPTDEFTLMVMIPYVQTSMNHITRTGVRFKTEANGLGDVRLSGLLLLSDHNGHRVHANLGLSLPTGSIDERDDTPAMAQAKLPYPMQLGTGTFDLLPGLTYLGQSGDWSWGAQGTMRLHLDENDEGYRHGNRQSLTAWAARRMGSLSASLRLNIEHWENFHGADPDLNPAMVPTADPDRRGGDRTDLLIGLNWYAQEGPLAGHRLAVEFGFPVYQDLEGPQLERDWQLMIGWQLGF